MSCCSITDSRAQPLRQPGNQLTKQPPFFAAPCRADDDDDDDCLQSAMLATTPGPGSQQFIQPCILSLTICICILGTLQSAPECVCVCESEGGTYLLPSIAIAIAIPNPKSIPPSSQSRDAPAYCPLFRVPGNTSSISF